MTRPSSIVALVALIGAISAAGCHFETAGLSDEASLGPALDSGGSAVAFDTRSGDDTRLDDATGFDTLVADTGPAPVDAPLDARADALDAPDARDVGVTAPDTAPDTVVVDTAPEAPADTRPPCAEPGAIVSGGHCYFTISNATLVTWTAAKAQCAAATPPAHLATFDTPGEHALGDLLCPATHHCFIDLVSSAPSSTPTDFRWDDGELGFDGPWCGGYPNKLGTCGSWFKADATTPGCAQDLDCVTNPHGHVLCERD